jgi:hypothetical protein
MLPSSSSRWTLALLLAVATHAAEPVLADAPAEVASPAVAPTSAPLEPKLERTEVAASESYADVVSRVERMTADSDLHRRVEARGLSLVNVAWEDTGRAEGSALGPNISDLTLQVRVLDQSRTALMPVIRFPNFTDKTADVRADRFFVRTGNQLVAGETGAGTLRTVLLEDAIRNLRPLLSRPEELGFHGNLHALRDTHFLVSAQAVFLPIPKSGEATFNPVVFNYQSAPDSPAVLTMLVTRQGTSVTVVENRSEDSAGGWGQELYFNAGGQRARLTAERRSDVVARIEADGGPKSEDDASALAAGADVLFLVQVPLKHAQRGLLGGIFGDSIGTMGFGAGGFGLGVGAGAARVAQGNVERAVLGHGDGLGRFEETRGLKLVRDAKFPIRITVQFYKATSDGVVTDEDLDGIARSIGGVYEHADFVGSLVVPGDDPRRPTSWQTVPNEWFPW